MKDKYWYKIDFSKATKSLAQSISKHFHVWDNLLLNSQIIKYKSKTNNKQSVLFSFPEQFTKSMISGEEDKEVLSSMKFDFGKFTAIFEGKNLNKNFKRLESIKISNKKIGEVSYTINKVVSGNPNNLFDPDTNNIVIGSQYNDKHLEGDGGQNIIYGGKGNDKIYITGEENIVYGGSGSDVLDIMGDSHKVHGGKGNDIFKLSNNGKGKHLIADFKNEQDKIYIGSIKKLKLKNKKSDVYIYSDDDQGGEAKYLLAKVKGAKGLLSKKGKYLV